MPGTPDQAVDIALANNPDLIGDQLSDPRRRARRQRSRAPRRLPTVSAISGGTYNNFLGTADDQFGGVGNANSATVATAGVQARIPIYQGGLVGARVRQAQATQSQLLEQGIAIERSVVANTRAAFASYQAALEAIESNQIAVNANTLALEGTRAEQSVGTRNVLDVLNAEQELLNSQVALVTARRDAYVAGFALLNAMGAGRGQGPQSRRRRALRSDRQLSPGRRPRSDWSDDPKPQPVATRTAPEGTPAPGSSTTPVTDPRN